MDLSDTRTFELFLEVYGTLPRAGPGSTRDTNRALELVPGDEPRHVLDLGCGPGAQTLALAQALPKSRITALDLTQAMVDEARRRVEEAGLSDRVLLDVGDLCAPRVPEESQDLIWCEGAIYFAGVQQALETWKVLLRSGGSVAFTEPVWTHPSPPDPLRNWWEGQYPAITHEDGVRRAIEAAGYETIGCFVLPAASWWDEYYRPMRERVGAFRAEHAGDDLAAKIADEAEEEIAMFETYQDYYSYEFFVVRPEGP